METKQGKKHWKVTVQAIRVLTWEVDEDETKMRKWLKDNPGEIDSAFIGSYYGTNERLNSTGFHPNTDIEILEIEKIS